MKGRKGFINNASKKATENFGDSKIRTIVKALSDCGFYCKIEPKIHNEKFSTKNKIRNPDIEIIFGGMKIYLESDGKVHGDLESPTKSTIMRNNDFANTGMNCIIINHDHVKYLKKILGLVANDDDLIQFLSAYRACEEYCNHISNNET